MLKLEEGALTLIINPIITLLALALICYSLVKLRKIKYVFTVSIFLMLTLLLLLFHSVVRILELSHTLFAVFLTLASLFMLISILIIYYKIPVYNIKGEN